MNKEVVSNSKQSVVPNKQEKWRPKTAAGRLTKAGVFTDYATVRRSRHEIKEPEIADSFFGDVLIVAPLKTVPIGEGEYRFKAFVAVGDGRNYIGLGQRCAADRKTAEEGATRNAKLNMMKIKKTWLRPVTGVHAEVVVRLHPHQQLIARPMIRKIFDTAGIAGCKVETNHEKDSYRVVLAVFDALSKLETLY